MQHWLRALKSDCLQSTTEEIGPWPAHVMQTAEILNIIKFPDITKHQISNKNNPRDSLALSRDRPSYRS